MKHDNPISTCPGGITGKKEKSKMTDKDYLQSQLDKIEALKIRLRQISFSADAKENALVIMEKRIISNYAHY